MTMRAFDTRGNLADRLFRCLETPHSDVLEHHTVPATKSMPLDAVAKRLGAPQQDAESAYTGWGSGFPCGLNGSRYLDLGSGHKLLASTFIGLFWGAMDKASERLNAAIFAILERKKDVGPLLSL